MKPIITRADVIRLVPLLVVPEHYDFQTDIVLAIEETSTRFFKPEVWNSLLEARSAGQLSALQSLCLHKLETVLAYAVALKALPLILETKQGDGKVYAQVQYRLSSLCRYFQKGFRQWLENHASDWLPNVPQSDTQFGLYLPAL